MKNDKPFQKIPDASKTTGLSQYFLRNGCKDGTCPHVMSGGTYYINIPALLRKLGADNPPTSGVDGSNRRVEV